MNFKLDPIRDIPVDADGKPLSSLSLAKYNDEEWMKGDFFIQSLIQDMGTIENIGSYIAGMKWGASYVWERASSHQASRAIDILTVARSYVEELLEAAKRDEERILKEAEWNKNK